MDNKFIAIGREYGSGGHKVGELLSNRLKLSYFDKELISLAAQKGDINPQHLEPFDEKKANPLFNTMNYYGNAEVAKGVPMVDTLFTLQSETILDIAQKESAIFVGRCADQVLRSNDFKVLSVFISAPFDERVMRTALLEDMDQKEVVLITRKKDKDRRKYYEAHTDRTWGVPESYDMFFDTSTTDINRIVDMIAERYNEL